jgi:hypothetical protein
MPRSGPDFSCVDRAFTLRYASGNSPLEALCRSAKHRSPVPLLLVVIHKGRVRGGGGGGAQRSLGDNRLHFLATAERRPRFFNRVFLIAFF